MVFFKAYFAHSKSEVPNPHHIPCTYSSPDSNQGTQRMTLLHCRPEKKMTWVSVHHMTADSGKFLGLLQFRKKDDLGLCILQDHRFR